MLYRTMPGSDDELSVLGFGAMRMPEKRGRIDVGRATAQVRALIDGGVNYIDTAWPYHGGESEPFLARALADGYRERVALATKLPHWLVRSHSDMDHLLAAQLDNLQTERIDYYLVHALDGATWSRMCALGVCDFLQRARDDGRIGRAGFSFHGDRDAFLEIVDGWDWDFCQIQYNYLDDELGAGREGLLYAAERGLGIVAMEPLRGGLLGREAPPSVQAVWDEAPVKRSPAEWALRWVWNHPEVTLLLSGMNDETHVAENLRLAGEAQPNSLTDEELDLIARAAAEHRRLMRVGCTGCGYCMPCPAGVDIPACFEMYNLAHVSGEVAKARFHYLGRLGGVLGQSPPGYASQCIDCGKCEQVCPQKLPVRELLGDVAREFEGPMLRVLTWLGRPLLAAAGWWAVRRAKRSARRTGPGAANDGRAIHHSGGD